LDAGCGSGAYALYAAVIGNEVLGLSFDQRNTEVARTRASILGINARFLEVDLKDLSKVVEELGLFDQIICFETIEHIMDDHRLMADLSSLLIPGGRLLLTTPFKYYRRLFGDKLSTSEDGGHVRWGYTHEEIRRLFDQYGLETQVEEYISGFVSQQVTNLQRILSRVLGILAWAITFPLRVLRWTDKPLTRVLGYPYLSIGVIGVKR
jgi:2-polyprenyl-3-methyl-5-hydroxy-6-metoxy-1,4-benzoquinol methylase